MKKLGTGYASTYMGAMIRFGINDESNVRVSVNPDGSLLVASAAADLGEGLGMTLSIIVSEAFGGLDQDQIHLLLNDSAKAPDGMVTAASRQTTMTGMATYQACETLSAKLLSLASEILDVPTEQLSWIGGLVVDKNQPEHFISLPAMADEAKRVGIELVTQAKFVAPLTTPLDPETGKSELPINSFSYATVAADVEVDTDTGVVQVLKLTAIMDSGKIINIEGAEGQVEGGLMMGLGFALTEDFIHTKGIPMTRGYYQYSIPSFVDCGEIEVHFVEDSPGFGPYGAKGLGESPTVITAPAILNAIYDAIGVRIYSLPATPERVIRALREHKAVVEEA
ncbi:MAG: molybdopterin-dependent oxidoreductase [Anaerolineaceae bacterium]|nr:molybdopterin-dependent oxidoreductase [Anaerolineaceae bacterium]